MFYRCSGAYIFRLTKWCVLSFSILGLAWWGNNWIKIISLSCWHIVFWTGISLGSHTSFKVVKLFLQSSTCNRSSNALSLGGFRSRLGSGRSCLLLRCSSLAWLLSLTALLWSTSIGCSPSAGTSASQRTVMDVDGVFFVYSESLRDSTRWKHQFAIVNSWPVWTILDWTLWEVKLRQDSLCKFLQC